MILLLVPVVSPVRVTLTLHFTLIIPSINNNRTLVPRNRVGTDPGNSGYPFGREPWLEEIRNLPGGFKYASTRLPAFQSSFVIRMDDPNAYGFVGRWTGGGTRDDIYGNQ